MEEAESLCDRVAFVRSGEVIALDTPANLVRGLNAPTRVVIPTAQLTPEQAKGLDGADEVATEGLSTVITTRAVGRVLAAVGGLTELQDVQTRTATLEDVYLELTGTEYQA